MRNRRVGRLRPSGDPTDRLLDCAGGLWNGNSRDGISPTGTPTASRRSTRAPWTRQPGKSGAFRFPGDSRLRGSRGRGERSPTPATASCHTAFTYASKPDGPLLFAYSDEDHSGNLPVWELPYQRAIPATGGLDLSFAYAQGFSLGDVQALARSAQAAFTKPSPPVTKPVPKPPVTPPPAAAETSPGVARRLTSRKLVIKR